MTKENKNYKLDIITTRGNGVKLTSTVEYFSDDSLLNSMLFDYKTEHILLGIKRELQRVGLQEINLGKIFVKDKLLNFSVSSSINHDLKNVGFDPVNNNLVRYIGLLWSTTNCKTNPLLEYILFHEKMVASKNYTLKAVINKDQLVLTYEPYI